MWTSPFCKWNLQQLKEKMILETLLAVGSVAGALVFMEANSFKAAALTFYAGISHNSEASCSYAHPLFRAPYALIRDGGALNSAFLRNRETL